MAVKMVTVLTGRMYTHAFIPDLVGIQTESSPALKQHRARTRVKVVISQKIHLSVKKFIHYITIHLVSMQEVLCPVKRWKVRVLRFGRQIGVECT